MKFSENIKLLTAALLTDIARANKQMSDEEMAISVGVTFAILIFMLMMIACIGYYCNSASRRRQNTEVQPRATAEEGPASVHETEVVMGVVMQNSI